MDKLHPNLFKSETSSLRLFVPHSETYSALVREIDASTRSASFKQQ
jgi:hypothetical protein